MDMSTYLRNAIVNSFLRGAPAVGGWQNIHLALFVAAPTPAGLPAGEVTAQTWPGYARADLGDLETAFVEPVDGVTQNTRRINFNANAGAQTLVITHMALYDAPVDGNLLFQSELVKLEVVPDPADPDSGATITNVTPGPKRIEPGDELSFAPGMLTFVAK